MQMEIYFTDRAALAAGLPDVISPPDAQRRAVEFRRRLEVGGHGGMRLAEFTPGLLDAFEVHLHASVPQRRTAHSYLLVVVALLRQVRERRPKALHADMPARLRFAGRESTPRPSQVVSSASRTSATASTSWTST